MTTTDRFGVQEFVVAHERALLAFAQRQLSKYRIPSGTLQAEDVVQYTFLELFERWIEIRKPEHYMFTVARRYVLRAARERQHFTGAPYDEVSALELSVQPATPEEQLVARAQTDQIHCELGKLTPRQHHAVRLLVLLGMSRASAAATMQVAEGSLSAHRDRGLEKLRSGLSGFLAVIIVVAVVFGLLPGDGHDVLAAAARWLYELLRLQPRFLGVPEPVWWVALAALQVAAMVLVRRQVPTAELADTVQALQAARSSGVHLYEVKNDAERAVLLNLLSSMHQALARLPKRQRARLLKEAGLRDLGDLVGSAPHVSPVRRRVRGGR
ncbi:RNA polymerase sigma factor [Actinoplanes sp. NPDC020271]|uniref:RNA polymerase sigma factor n=1 Tax=Actinoplanes sp. NPDC020271 TaxID=3363896 RepID=UPI003790F574